jgi:hypothetical protein
MNDITVVIPICAMPSHPGTDVLDITLASIRERLPESEIILMFDGMNPNLMHFTANYQKHIQTMLWRCNFEYTNVSAMVFDEHMHQSLMLKAALDRITTPLLLWSEQDTPLDGEIPFDKIAEVVKTGYANLVRFHHEAAVHPEHEHLMLDHEPQTILDVPLIRTVQWSGRPHLASTDFYRQLVRDHWTDRPEFIEHRMYGIVVESPFEQYRLHLYAPEGTQVRSKHLDGRRYGADHYDPSAS